MFYISFEFIAKPSFWNSILAFLWLQPFTGVRVSISQSTLGYRQDRRFFMIGQTDNGDYKLSQHHHFSFYDETALTLLVQLEQHEADDPLTSIAVIRDWLTKQKAQFEFGDLTTATINMCLEDLRQLEKTHLRKDKITALPTVLNIRK